MRYVISDSGGSVRAIFNNRQKAIGYAMALKELGLKKIRVDKDQIKSRINNISIFKITKLDRKSVV